MSLIKVHSKIIWVFPVLIGVIACSPNSNAAPILLTSTPVVQSIPVLPTSTTSEIKPNDDVYHSLPTLIPTLQVSKPVVLHTPTLATTPTMEELKIERPPIYTPLFCLLPINQNVWKPQFINNQKNELGMLSHTFKSILIIPNDVIWAITLGCPNEEKGVIKLDLKSQKVTHYADYETRGTRGFSPFFHRTRDNILWLINLTTAPVLSRYDQTKDRFVPIYNDFLDTNPDYRNFMNFGEDSSGGFWFEGVRDNSGALLRYDHRTNKTQIFKIRHPLNQARFLVTRFIIASDDLIWILGGYQLKNSDIDSRRIIRFNYKTGEIKDFGVEPTTLGLGFFYAMGMDRNNNLWVGNYALNGDSEFFALDAKLRQWTNLGETSIFKLNIDYNPGILESGPININLMKNGEMWAQGQSGLIRYNSKSKKWELIGPGLRDFYEDDKGCVWSVGQGQVWKYCPPQ